MQKKRIQYRQSQRTRLSTKIKIVSGVASVFFMAATFLFIMNFSRSEKSMANEQAAINKSIFILQDTVPILRGSLKQPIICIVLNDKDKLATGELKSFVFSLWGSSSPYLSNIESVTLWFGGKDSTFANAVQSGTILKRIPETDFKFNIVNPLVAGNNYFWLVADVKGNAESNGVIDAELLAINYEKTIIKPMNGAPLGSKRIGNNSAFFSINHADLSNLKSWNTNRDGKGDFPQSLNDSNACFFVQKNHKVTITKPVTIPRMNVEAGAALAVRANAAVDHLNILTGGSVLFEVAENQCSCIENLVMENNSILIYNSTGVFAAKNAELHSLSTIEYRNYGVASIPKGILWANVIINAETNPSVNIDGAFEHVNENFEFLSKGWTALYLKEKNELNLSVNLLSRNDNFSGDRSSQN